MNQANPSSNDAPNEAPRHFGIQRLPTYAVVLAGSFMLAISWRKWPDLITDYGNQLYLPWRISEGEVLYRDLFYIYGPLSQYIHAFLFKLFGVDFLVIALFNIGIIIALSILLYKLFLSLSNKWTAHWVVLSFLTLSAFSHLSHMGNFNFVSAYRHELPHGVALALLSAYFFLRYCQTERTRWLFWLGTGTGLVFLTKSEVFFAWSVALVPTLLASLILKQDEKAFKNFTCFLMFALIPPLLFTAYLISVLGSKGFEAMLIPWEMTLNPDLRNTPFYQLVMGSNLPIENSFRMAQYGLAWLVLLIAGLGTNHVLKKWNGSVVLRWGLFLSVLIAGYLVYYPFIWLESVRPLPLLTALLLAYRLISVFKTDASTRLKKELPLLALTVFGFLLLMKMAFYGRLSYYGFALSLPAVLLLIHFVFHDICEMAEVRSGGCKIFRSLATGMLIIFIAGNVMISFKYYSQKNLAVGLNDERFMDYEASRRAKMYQIALEILNDQLKPGEAFTAFPVSAMMNYMTRRPNAIIYDNFTPTEQLVIGEEPVITGLKTSSPRFILIVNHDFQDFGARTFGRDFAVRIYKWIKDNYRPEYTVGADPVEDPDKFGIQFWVLQGGPDDISPSAITSDRTERKMGPMK